MADIIVVDDEPAILNAVARFLRICGHEVRTSSDGREAMTALDEGPADLVITDINMPDMDGIEILNELRRRSHAIPVIAMSGGGRIDKQILLASADLLGAVVTIAKPFELEDLRRTVDAVLGNEG